jgi:hypothetical protein
MTSDELALNGPPADGQVTVIDLRPCREYVATRHDFDLDFYVPAYPAGLGQEPTPRDLAFLLQIWDDDTRRRLMEQPGQVEFTCWAHRRARVVEVCQGPGQIEEWVRDGLQKKYPGIRLPKIVVLTIGHGSTPTPERARSGFRYGIGELLIGGALLSWVAFQRRRRTGTGVLELAGETRVHRPSGQ